MRDDCVALVSLLLILRLPFDGDSVMVSNFHVYWINVVLTYFSFYYLAH